MTIHHRKSAALAIDGKPQPGLASAQDSAIDIDDITIWLTHYLQEHGTPGLAVQADTAFSQAGLDAAACNTLLAAFEFRYSVRIGALCAGCFSNVKACAAFLLAQVTAAPAADQDISACPDLRHMVRTPLGPH